MKKIKNSNLSIIIVNAVGLVTLETGFFLFGLSEYAAVILVGSLTGLTVQLIQHNYTLITQNNTK